jgi:hypothetical protein
MSKCKKQGLRKVMCGLSIALLLSTTPLIAMEENHNEKGKFSRMVKERTDPNEIKTINRNSRPFQSGCINYPEPSADGPDQSFSGMLGSEFVDPRGD